MAVRHRAPLARGTDYIYVNEVGDIAAAIANAELQDKVVLITDDTTIRIPTDAATMQIACDYTQTIHDKINVTLQIASGHEIATGLSVSNRNLGNYRITSVDAEVDVASTFTGNLITGINSRMPVLACLFDMKNLGERGAHIQQTSNFVVESGCGVKNAGLFGIDLSNSMCYAIGSVWSGAGTTGIRLEQAAVGTFQNGIADDCGEIGIFASRSSVANFINGSAQRAGVSALQAQRATISCGNSNLSDAGQFGINAREASQVFAGIATIDNAGETAILATSNANVNFRAGFARDAVQYGVYAYEGAVVTVEGATVTGSGTADLRVRSGGIIHASGTTTTSSVDEPSLDDTENIITFNHWSNFGIITAETGYAQNFSLARVMDDDTAFSFELPGSSSAPCIMAIRNASLGNGRANGLVLVRTGNTPVCQSLVLDTTTNITLTTGALTGTTGTDGNFTISCHTDFKVYFENRTGASQSIFVTFLGAFIV